MTCNHSQEGVYIACVHCDIEHATLAERERINGIIEQFIENSDYPEVVSSLEWLQDVINV